MILSSICLTPIRPPIRPQYPFSERIADLGGSGTGWLAKESFTGARYEAKTGRTLRRLTSEEKRNLNKNCDWIDNAGEYLDAVGPYSPSEIRGDLETDALRSLKRHFQDPTKGYPVIELAGLPESEAAIVEKAALDWAAQYNKQVHFIKD